MRWRCETAKKKMREFGRNCRQKSKEKAKKKRRIYL